MKIRLILASFLLVSVVLGIVERTSCHAHGGRSEVETPNVLFIFLDDFGWRDTSYMGSDFYETPNIDRISKRGMVFRNAYSCAANCAPARACLLSGQYTPRHKIYNVGTSPRGNEKFRRLKHVPGVDVLDPKIKTWAHQIQAAGYKTGTFGKWHLSDDPIPYGFDVNIGGSHSGGPPNGYYPPHRNVPGLANAPKDEYITDRLSDEVIKFIRENKDGRWFAYLTHFAVHTPLHPKKELIEKYQNKPKGKLHKNSKMATMIQAVDDGVGRILKALDELDLTDNTVIIFYSDNGGYGPATDMAPLKGYKGTYYEGGIREPFFVCWPNTIKAGTTSDEPITGVDLFPTLCEITGAKLPENQVADGKSLLPLFTNVLDSFGRRPIFWHFPAYLQSYRAVVDEQQDPLFRSRPCSVVRDGDWKLIQFFEKGELELYNLKDDQGETKNLATVMPDKARQLLKTLQDWQKEVDADIPMTPNPKYDEQAERAAIAKRDNGSGNRRNRNNKN